jgi:hypothetical protein
MFLSVNNNNNKSKILLIVQKFCYTDLKLYKNRSWYSTLHLIYWAGIVSLTLTYHVHLPLFHNMYQIKDLRSYRPLSWYKAAFHYRVETITLLASLVHSTSSLSSYCTGCIIAVSYFGNSKAQNTSVCSNFNTSLLKISLLASLNTAYVPNDAFLSSVQQANMLTANLEENAGDVRRDCTRAEGAVLISMYSEHTKWGNCPSFEAGLWICK